MNGKSAVLSTILAFIGVPGTSVAVAADPPTPTEKLVEADCAKQALSRDKVESWKSTLAAEGRVFRYKLGAIPAREKQEIPPERYAMVFVDPDTGNTYDLKRVPGGDKTLNQRTLAIMRLMGTKVTNSKHAEAVMADLLRIHDWLETAHDRDDPVTVRMVEVKKGESWIQPATTYAADHGKGLRLVMMVDEDSYVTEFRILNVR